MFCLDAVEGCPCRQRLAAIGDRPHPLDSSNSTNAFCGKSYSSSYHMIHCGICSATSLTFLLASAWSVVRTTPASAQHQTPVISPLVPAAALNYSLRLRELSFAATSLPGLHSFAAGTADGKWVILAGRTNGVHGLDQSGLGSFPADAENHDVWVIDPVAKQAWHRSLGAGVAAVDPQSGLSPDQIASLVTTNSQYEQVGDTLYVAGGYGLNSSGEFETFNKFTAINLPGLASWAMGGGGQARDSIRQIDSAIASVTGGAMY